MTIVKLELSLSYDEYYAVEAMEGSTREESLEKAIRYLIKDKIREAKSYNCSKNTEDYIKRRLIETDDYNDFISLKDLYGDYLIYVITEGEGSDKEGKHKFRRRIQRMNVKFGCFENNVRGFKGLKLVKRSQLKTDEDLEWEL